MIYRAFALPPADDLLAAPELATLALLDAACRVAMLALGSGYPELMTDDRFDEPEELRAAVTLIHAARELCDAIDVYRRAIHYARERQIVFPF